MFHFGTNHHDNGGTASCRSAVFFGFEEDGRGLGEDGRGLREDLERTWRMGEDFERKKRGLLGRRNETLKRKKQGLGTGQNKDLETEKKWNRESCDSIGHFR